jgi:hypothetical protein
MKTRESRPRERPGAVRPDGRDGGVQAFFDRFARALTAGDGKAIAGMWAVPALVVGDKSVQAVGSLREVEEFFRGAKDQYNALGITGTRADIRRLDWLTDRIVMADVRWPYLDANGNEKGEESSTYTLRKDDTGELKMQVVVMRGATVPG